MTKIRGASVALQHLAAELAAIKSWAAEISDHPANVPLVAFDAGMILQTVEKLAEWHENTLDPMLERREKAGQTDLDDLIRRISQLEQAMLALQNPTAAPIVRFEERRGGGR